MKIIIDKEFPIEIKDAQESLDVADYFDRVGVKFNHSWGFWLIIEKQVLDLGVVHTEDFLDVVQKYVGDIALVRAERSLYFLRNY